MRRVLARSVLIATLAVALTAGTALGHECFVASRSTTGDLAAGSHSKVWTTVATLRELFSLPLVPGTDPLTESQVDWAVATAEAQGLPEVFTIFTGSHTIADGTPAMDRFAADGKGIDHAFDWFPVIIGIYLEAHAQ